MTEENGFIIRKAEPDDVKEIMNLLYEFYVYSDHQKYNLNFDYMRSAKYLQDSITNNSFVVLVAEVSEKIVGHIGGVINPWKGDFTQWMLSELVWWVKPGNPNIGLKLLEEFENTAMERGIKYCIVCSLDSQDNKGMERIYKNRGYNLLEHRYIKEL